MKKYILVTLLALFSAPTFSHADSIQITKPSANEVLLRGQSYRITWTGGASKVDLYRINCVAIVPAPSKSCFINSNGAVPFASNIDNVGYFDWTAD